MWAAQQQNSEAQFKLGDLYAFGQGVEKDEFTAYDWYWKSALQGYPKALTRIHNLYHIEAGMYCRGQRDTKENECATPEFKKKNKIRELNEYRIEQLQSELTNTKEYFSNLFITCHKQIRDEMQQDKINAYSTLGFLYQHGYGIRQITSRAIEFYTLAANQGNTDAAFNLGFIYHQHYSWKWNYREAFKWYTIAANNGNCGAQNGLAFLYLKGLGTEISYSDALYWYNKAAESRHINAMISLASIFRKGDIVKQDDKKTLEWYTKAIKEGSTVTENSLESFYNKKSNFTTVNGPKVYTKKGLCSKLHADVANIPESAGLEKLKQLAMNCKKGDGHAMFDIGKRYLQGDGFPQDKYVAFKWIKNAAKAKLNEARRTVAQMYKDGDCIEQDYHKASIWYKKAAKTGDTKARYELGLMYYHGLGVRKDPLEASKWYTFAADKNNSDAQCQLGILRERGEGLTQDTLEAIRLYNEAAKQKNPHAIFKLAQVYEGGSGVEESFELAFKLFGIAARLGSLDAQLKLAKIYGDNEKQCYDTKTSFKYYQMASNQGSSEAKYKMAIMYLDGQGTSQDLTKAYYLFKESSNLDHNNATNIFSIPIDYSKSSDIDYKKVTAMFATVCEKGIDSLEFNLGYLYNQDSVFMYNNYLIPITANVFIKEMWYEKAADKGNPMALYELGVASKNKNRQAKIQDLSMAIGYFERAYATGNINATYKLASMYLHGYGVSQDLKKAFYLLNEAADMGHKEAYETLNNFNTDDEESKLEAVRKILKVSAESGHVLSQYKLGILVSDTKSSYYNIKEAIKWLKMASSGGFINAQYSLGLLLETENTSKKEHQKIVSLYQIAADKGNELASFRLAQLYHKGIKKDYLEAFRLYTLAAEQGYQPAQLAICVLSEPVWRRKRNQLPDNAITGKLDYVSCFQMWEKMADQGDVELQFSLGMTYEENNTDLSLSEAARWYSRAAARSHNLALYHLGRLYEVGRGVNQDYSEAIKYYQIASNLGNNDAQYKLGGIYQD
ncbi:HCP-like protein, partial [Backusella circina FSU 941]